MWKALAGGLGLVTLLACGTILATGSPDDGTLDAGLDANIADCALRRLPMPGDLYASANGSPDAGCGSSEPCTLPVALERANDGGATVNLSEGLYEGDVVLPAQTRIIGGFRVEQDGAWTPVCDQRIVQLRGTTGGAVVRVTDAPGVRLDLLTVLPPAVPAGPSESRYGVIARGPTTTLTLDGVAVIAGRGGDGDAGVPGTVGAAGGNGCVPGSGAAGADGPNGDPSTSTFGPDGFGASQGSMGQAGGSGQPGLAGTPGEALSGVRCISTEEGCIQSACSDQAGSGQTGCNGAGGTAGTGGFGGGGSFGIFAWNGANVSLLGGIVSATVGGHGGAGGAASAGGAGGPGAAGATIASVCSPAGSCIFGCQNSGSTLQGGAAGGPGGKGGSGGAGGGGAGGPSYSLVVGGDAKLRVDATKLLFDRGGEGGSPNGPPGGSGARAF